MIEGALDARTRNCKRQTGHHRQFWRFCGDNISYQSIPVVSIVCTLFSERSPYSLSNNSWRTSNLKKQDNCDYNELRQSGQVKCYRVGRLHSWRKQYKSPENTSSRKPRFISVYFCFFATDNIQIHRSSLLTLSFYSACVFTQPLRGYTTNGRKSSSEIRSLQIWCGLEGKSTIFRFTRLGHCRLHRLWQEDSCMRR